MHRILALGLRISKYCWEDLTHYSRCRYYPYQEGQKRSWSAVGGCRGMSRERSKCTIQVGKRQRSVQQHTTSLTVLFTSNSSGAAMFMSTTSWRTDLVRFIVLVVLLRWTSAQETQWLWVRVASWNYMTSSNQGCAWHPSWSTTTDIMSQQAKTLKIIGINNTISFLNSDEWSKCLLVTSWLEEHWSVFVGT